jgi:hypothetical protein
MVHRVVLAHRRRRCRRTGRTRLGVLGLSDTVEVAVRAHQLDEAAVHIASFQQWVEQFPTPARLSLLARCQALAAVSDAEPHFLRSLELAAALSPFERARSELLYGEWLRREQGVRQAADRFPRRPGANGPRRAHLHLTGDTTGGRADATARCDRHRRGMQNAQHGRQPAAQQVRVVIVDPHPSFGQPATRSSRPRDSRSWRTSTAATAQRTW